MKEIVVIIGGVVVVLAILFGFDVRVVCERAGGVNIDYQVCVPRGTQILMTS